MEFVALPGTLGTLLPASGDQLVAVGNIPGAVDMMDFDALLDPTLPTERLFYNPTLFEFTTPEGYAYLIDEKTGLQRMSDPKGNTLTVTRDGILHSSGKSILFTRDAQGQITGITDPAGHTTTYTYDAARNLIGFSDRENNNTTFAYDGTHGLLSITDPRGIQAARNEYDTDGRLIRHIDATGKQVNYTHNLNTRRRSPPTGWATQRSRNTTSGAMWCAALTRWATRPPTFTTITTIFCSRVIQVVPAGLHSPTTRNKTASP
jgi:YD repeat-containing protein